MSDVKAATGQSVSEQAVNTGDRGFWIDLRSKRNITEQHLDEYTSADYNYYDPLLSPKVGVVNIKPPFDWAREDLPRSWRLNLHSFRFADYWIKRYQIDGDVERLRRLLSVVLDYIEQVWNKQKKAQDLEFVLSDVSVASRAAVLSFTLNQVKGLSRNIGEIEKVTKALEEHVQYAASDENYNSNNHGLFNDLHLLISFINYPEFEQVDKYVQKVSSRFLNTFIQRQISNEFVHLEHTPSYALLWILLGEKACSIFDALTRAGLGNSVHSGSDIRSVIENVRTNLWWFIRPDGTLLNLGDQGKVVAPDWMRSIAGKYGQKNFLESGYSFYKSETSHVALIAAYHSTKIDRKGYRSSSHKQRDELSILWSEGGENVLVDSGLRAFDYGPERRYTFTKQAHSTLSFAPADFMEDGILAYMDATSPYGSGIIRVVSCGGQDDLVIMAAEDRLLDRHGIYHIRLLVYQPGKWLGVIDLVRLKKGARAEWNFHFDYPWKCVRHGVHGALLKYGKRHISVDRLGSSVARSPHAFLHRGDFFPLRGWMFAGDPIPLTNLRYVEWLERKKAHARVTFMAYASTVGTVRSGSISIKGVDLSLTLELEMDSGVEHVEKSFGLESDIFEKLSSSSQLDLTLVS